jgi:hypothetical protein
MQRPNVREDITPLAARYTDEHFPTDGAGLAAIWAPESVPSRLTISRPPLNIVVEQAVPPS